MVVSWRGVRFVCACLTHYSVADHINHQKGFILVNNPQKKSSRQPIAEPPTYPRGFPFVFRLLALPPPSCFISCLSLCLHALPTNNAFTFHHDDDDDGARRCLAAVAAPLNLVIHSSRSLTFSLLKAKRICGAIPSTPLTLYPFMEQGNTCGPSVKQTIKTCGSSNGWGALDTTPTCTIVDKKEASTSRMPRTTSSPVVVVNKRVACLTCQPEPRPFLPPLV